MKSDNFSFLSGGAVLKIEGFNQNRLLSSLTKDGVKVYSLQRESAKVLRLTVRKKHLAKTLETTEKLGFQTTVEKRVGLGNILRTLLKRLGVFVTAAAVIAAYSLSYGFVWRVEVGGTDRVDAYAITEVLSGIGLRRGTKRNAVDTVKAESAVRKIDGIAEATVRLIGTTLKVDVVENLGYVPRPSGGVRQIESLYDAEITRITVREGTPKVKVGQRVFAGAPLISGDILNTEGGVIKEGFASGEVYGKVVFSESVTVAAKGTRAVATGRVKRSTVLSVFGLKIGKRSDGFEYASTTEKTEKLTFFPIRVTTVTAREFVYEEYELDREQMLKEAESAVRNRLNERLVSDAQSEQLVIKDIGGGVTEVTLFVTVEMLIGEA